MWGSCWKRNVRITLGHGSQTALSNQVSDHSLLGRIVTKIYLFHTCAPLLITLHSHSLSSPRDWAGYCFGEKIRYTLVKAFSVMLISIHFLCLCQFAPTLSFLGLPPWGEDSLQLRNSTQGRSCTKSNVKHWLHLKIHINTHKKCVSHEDRCFFIWQDLFLSLNNLFLWLKCVISVASDICNIIWLISEKYLFISMKCQNSVGLFYPSCPFWASDKLTHDPKIPFAFIFLSGSPVRLGTSS